MKISLLQTKYPADYSETLSVMKQFMAAPDNCPKGTELLVLPEYSNCPGMPLSDINAIFAHCKKYNNDFLNSLKNSAIKTGIVISANMLFERKNGFTNTTFVIDTNGDIIAEYDKTHLAYTEIDSMSLIPGNKPVYSEFLGAKVTFAVCFELYFPEYFERLSSEYPDIILCPSYQRSEDSEILLKQAMGRALDSGAFVIRSSYSMGEDSKTGAMSYVVNPSGEIILNAGQKTGFFSVDINPKEKRLRPLAHGLGKMPSREIVEKFRIPSLYRKSSGNLPENLKDYPKVCAHRGLSGLVPENTLVAFSSALALGADEIEFDIRLTSDNKMIVCHDATVDRVSDGSGNVSDFTFKEIRSLNAGEYMGWKNIKFPTPEEIFELLGNRIIMNIHIYETGHEGCVVRELKKLISKYDISSTVYFAAQEKEMAWCLKLAPEIERCMLECFKEDRDIVDIAMEYKCKRVQHFFKVYSPEIVKKATENGLLNNLFYEDDPQKIESRLDDGINIVLTNFADRIIPVVKNL
ncbi:MAG: hypothetical protein J7L77_05315 [Clostridiales bacterium]|nr:hypothetical protein [Clostridiales bacterium]